MNPLFYFKPLLLLFQFPNVYHNKLQECYITVLCRLSLGSPAGFYLYLIAYVSSNIFIEKEKYEL